MAVAGLLRGPTAEPDPGRLTGLTGWVASVIESLGEVGVGLLVALENLVPPIPSEVVLALAGYLASEGRVNPVLVVIAATVGSLVGALALYGLGYGLGEDRLRRLLDRLPLLDSSDLDTADRWFERHAKSAVLFGRMAPVVRSLVSIPAGANHMPLGQFAVLTALGSGIWNTAFVSAGYALGSQWRLVERYSGWFNYAVIAFLAGTILWWWIKKARRQRARPVDDAVSAPVRPGTPGRWRTQTTPRSGPPPSPKTSPNRRGREGS